MCRICTYQCCSKRILRTGIILYGFKLTSQDVMQVGLPAILMDAIIVCGAIALGLFFGTLSMFFYLILYRIGIFDLSPEMMGLFTGATLRLSAARKNISSYNLATYFFPVHS